MEVKMKEKIANAYCKWEQHIDLRFDYASRAQFMPLNEFPELFQTTFEVIREMNNKYFFEGAAPKDADVVMSYLRFLTFVSKYVIYDRVDDNSWNRYFTATSVITEKLLEYATRVGCYEFPDNDTVIYRDDDGEHQGIFEFSSDDYPPYECDSGECTKHIYKIYSPDFSDILALAAKIE